MRYTQFMDLYHILNRGIDGRRLFLDSSDYVRFVHNLYEFNDSKPAIAPARRNALNGNVRHRKSYIRKQLVQIHGWCLMKDHYHLLVSERVENGLTTFMRKLNIGYSKYYNERYKRHGHLFQGKTKRVPVERNAHFLYVLHYVHLNPLDYFPGASGWRDRDKGSIESVGPALDYLNKYRWSSYLDYCGTKNFASVLTTSLFSNALGEAYPYAVLNFLKDRVGTGLDLKSLE